MHVCIVQMYLQTLGLKTNSVKYKHIFNYISEFNVLHVARCNMHISCRPTLIWENPVFHTILQSLFLHSTSCGVLDNVCEKHSISG